MTVDTGKLVSIEYTLSLEDDTKVDSNVGGEPLSFVHGERQILPALEEALIGMESGDERQVVLTPEQGYGPEDPKLLQEVERERVPQEAQREGTPLTARDSSGQTYQLRVQEVKDKTVVLDLNHPLAGKKLIFDVKVLDVQA